MWEPDCNKEMINNITLCENLSGFKWSEGLRTAIFKKTKKTQSQVDRASHTTWWPAYCNPSPHMDGYNTLDAERTFGLCALKQIISNESHQSLDECTFCRRGTSCSHIIQMHVSSVWWYFEFEFSLHRLKADINDLYLSQQSAFTQTVHTAETAGF